MLSLRPAQLKVFEQNALTAFEDEMLAHARETWPRLCKLLGKPQMRAAVRAAIARAQGHGFTNRGPLRLFIELTFIFGGTFDTDPQYPWAAEILTAKDDQTDRADRLHAAVNRFQQRVAGEGAANKTRALDELRLFLQKPTAETSGNIVALARSDMGRTYPQKVAFVGEEALLKLIRAGSAEARKQGFDLPRADQIFTALMFAFGHSCVNDPLYPWLEWTLKDKPKDPAAARLARLEKAAATWIERVLAKPTA